MEFSDLLKYIKVNNLGTTRRNPDAAYPNSGQVLAPIDTSQGTIAITARSLTAGPGIDIKQNDADIVISLAGAAGAASTSSGVLNARYRPGPGAEIFSLEGSTMMFRRIIAGDNIVLNNLANGSLEIKFNPGTNIGDVRGAVNAGTAGQGLFVAKQNGVLSFRNLNAASNKLNITVDDEVNELLLDVNESAMRLDLMAGQLPADRVKNLHAVARTGSYGDLINKPSLVRNLGDLTDVTGSPVNGQYLKYNATLGKWGPVNLDLQNLYSRITAGGASVTPSSPTAQLTLDGKSSLDIKAVPATNTLTFELTKTGVAAGKYDNPSITVDEQGRVTAISTGTKPFVSPMTLKGQMMYFDNGVQARNVGLAGQVLTVSNDLPVWKNPPRAIDKILVNASPGLRGNVTFGAPKTSVEGFAMHDATVNIGFQANPALAGEYVNPYVIIDDYGQINYIESQEIVPGITSIMGDDVGIVAEAVDSDVTLHLAEVLASPGVFTNPTVTVDKYGRVTDIVSGTTGADFAEYFRNATGAPIPLGTIVTFDGDGVRPAVSDDIPFGVVSATAGVILNDEPQLDPFLKGEYGETLLDANGVPVPNPDYDANTPWQSRKNRPAEWTVVGLVGQVYVNVDITVEAGMWIRPRGSSSKFSSLGTRCPNPTNLYVLKITKPFDTNGGYGIALCLIK